VDNPLAIFTLPAIMMLLLMQKTAFYSVGWIVLAVVLLSVFALPVYAQPTSLPTSSCQNPPAGQTVLQCLWNRVVCTIVLWFFAVVIVISFIMLLVAALKFMTGGGDPKEIETAKKLLTFAVVGLIVALLVRVIVLVVAGLLGITNATNLLIC